VVIAAAALLGGCEQSPFGVVPVTDGSPVPVVLNALAPDPSTVLDGVVVSVSGPGIPQELVFNLSITQSGAATSTYDIPTGPARVFAAKALAGGIQPCESVTVTADVTRAGIAVDLVLRKILGAGGVSTTIEDHDVAIDDANPFIAAATEVMADKGASIPLSVKVTYSFGTRAGNPVVGAVVSWASENPGIVQVGSGACTTGANGTCSITASVPHSAKKSVPAGVIASHSGIAHRL